MNKKREKLKIFWNEKIRNKRQEIKLIKTQESIW